MSDDSRIVYGNTILQGINKAGSLKPDADGYYPTVLGALGIINSVGEEYIDTATARATFENSPSLLRRLSQGLLRAEWGHPKPSEYPNRLAFEQRIRQIDERMICAHIKEVWLENIQYEGQTVLGILGKVKPAGPYGPSLQAMFDDPDQNVTFSGRYYSNLSNRGGRRCREIHTVGTWDFVSEPGIQQAQKYCAPSLESMDDTYFYPDELIDAATYESSHQEAMSASLESGGLSASDLVEELRVVRGRPRTPLSHQW